MGRPPRSGHRHFRPRATIQGLTYRDQVRVQVHQAPPKEKRKEHEDLRKQLTNAKKNLRSEIEDAYRKDSFFQIHSEMMKRQLQKRLYKTVVEEDAENAKDIEPVIEHRLEKRTRLQQVPCHLSKDLSPQATAARKLPATNPTAAPVSTRTPNPQAEFRSSLQGSSQKKNLLLLIPFYYFMNFPSSVRRPSVYFASEMSGFHTTIRLAPSTAFLTWRTALNIFICVTCQQGNGQSATPLCVRLVNNAIHFKNHVATVHKINL